MLLSIVSCMERMLDFNDLLSPGERQVPFCSGDFPAFPGDCLGEVESWMVWLEVWQGTGSWG